MKRELIIAIDGYSSCGKSTFAKAIAMELDYLYIDSGAMYRAVTLYCMRRNYITERWLNTESITAEIKDIKIDFIFNNETRLYETFLNLENVEREIRTPGVSYFVSSVSQIAEVRAHMVELQRKIGSEGAIVMDGRDIGTVVFPDADLKIFMTASVDIRAKRRYEELKSLGIPTDLEDVKSNIIARDIADENRDISPLRRSDDAIILDNSRMTVKEQMVWVLQVIHKTRDGN